MSVGWHTIRTLEDASGYDAGVPQVSMDDAGSCTMAWTRTPSEFDAHVLVAQYSASQGLSPIQTKSYNAVPAGPLQLRGTSNGRAIAVFGVRNDNGGADVKALLYNPYGGGWGAPMTVDEYAAGSTYRPNGFVDAAGHAVVSWEQEVPGHEFGHTTYWASRLRPGQGFDTPLQLDSEGRPQRAVAAHIDGSGDGHLVFVRDRNDQGAVIAYPWHQDAGWQASVELHEGNPGNLLFTSLQVMGRDNGELYVLWTQKGMGTSLDGRWVTAAIHTPDGQWNRPIYIGNTKDLGPTKMSAALDPTGGATISWLERVDGANGVKYEVRARSLAADGHRGFSDLLNAGADRFAKDLEIVVGPTGRAVVGWTQYTTGLAEADVMVNRQD